MHVWDVYGDSLKAKVLNCHIDVYFVWHDIAKVFSAGLNNLQKNCW